VDGLFPYIWAVDKKDRLMRVLVSAEMVNSCKERRDFWQQLKSLVGLDEPEVDVETITAQAKADMAQKLTSTLLSLSSSGDISSIAAAATTGGNGANAPAAAGDWEPVWIESPECTSCDECIEINPKIFAYDENDMAYVLDPKGGPFKDIVKAAEKCTAGCLHPGTPYNPNEKGVDKFIKRAEKYQ
jgi:pyruvate-ferredoxin/flavodoxin oxidoreductase